MRGGVPAVAPPRAHRRLLAYFTAARTVSILGDRVAELTIPLAVLVATGSAQYAGLVAAAGLVPGVLLGLHVGLLVDRIDRRSLMVRCDLIRLPAFLLLAAELAAGGARPWVLLPMAALIGVADLLFATAAGTYLPAIVPESGLVRANSLVEAGDAGATLAGPAIGGVLFQYLGTFAAVSTNALSFLLSALLLFRLPADPPRVTPQAAQPARHDLLTGARHLVRDPAQRLLQAALLYMHLIAGAAGIVVIVFAVDRLALGAPALGVLLAAAGVGGLASSLLVAPFTEAAAWGPVLGAALALTGIAFLGLAASSSFAVAFLFVMLLDAASALSFITVISTRQRVTQRVVLGQVLATSAMSTATVRAAGAALGGVSASTLGAARTLVLLGALAAPPAAFALVSRAGRRQAGDAQPAMAQPPTT